MRNKPYPLYEDDDSRWRAIQARDALADGSFVYAVRTTKIYCRPICKARLARRANVRFYATGIEARDAGYRACKRCKPEQEGRMPEDKAVSRIRAYVESQGSKGLEGEPKVSLGQMAKQTGLSKWHFHRVFKKCVGVTPFEYARGLRETRDSDKTLPQDGQDLWMDQQAACFALDADLEWLQGLDNSDFYFAGLNASPAETSVNSADEVSTWDGIDGSIGASSSSTYSPLCLDDLMVWPEEAPLTEGWIHGQAGA